MVIVAISGNSVINTENIECFGFQVKFDKNNRPIVRNGAVLVNKKKINISFKSGNNISLRAINDTDGQIIFDNILKAMNEDNLIKKELLSKTLGIDI